MSSDENNSSKSDMELIMEMAEIAAQLGWQIAVPVGFEDADGTERVPGIVVGTSEFIFEVMGDDQDGSAYDLFTFDDEGTPLDPVKKGTYH